MSKEPTIQDIPKDVIQDFIEKLNELISHSVQMHHRLFEIEKSVGYLLSKDPEWMKAYNESLSVQEGTASSEQQEASGFVYPSE